MDNRDGLGAIHEEEDVIYGGYVPRDVSSSSSPPLRPALARSGPASPLRRCVSFNSKPRLDEEEPGLAQAAELRSNSFRTSPPSRLSPSVPPALDLFSASSKLGGNNFLARNERQVAGTEGRQEVEGSAQASALERAGIGRSSLLLGEVESQTDNEINKGTGHNNHCENNTDRSKVDRDPSGEAKAVGESGERVKVLGFGRSTLKSVHNQRNTGRPTPTNGEIFDVTALGAKQSTTSPSRMYPWDSPFFSVDALPGRGRLVPSPRRRSHPTRIFSQATGYTDLATSDPCFVRLRSGWGEQADASLQQSRQGSRPASAVSRVSRPSAELRASARPRSAVPRCAEQWSYPAAPPHARDFLVAPSLGPGIAAPVSKISQSSTSLCSRSLGEGRARPQSGLVNSRRAPPSRPRSAAPKLRAGIAPSPKLRPQSGTCFKSQAELYRQMQAASTWHSSKPLVGSADQSNPFADSLSTNRKEAIPRSSVLSVKINPEAGSGACSPSPKFKNGANASSAAKATNKLPLTQGVAMRFERSKGLAEREIPLPIAEHLQTAGVLASKHKNLYGKKTHKMLAIKERITQRRNAAANTQALLDVTPLPSDKSLLSESSFRKPKSAFGVDVSDEPLAPPQQQGSVIDNGVDIVHREVCREDGDGVHAPTRRGQSAKQKRRVSSAHPRSRSRRSSHGSEEGAGSSAQPSLSKGSGADEDQGICRSPAREAAPAPGVTVSATARADAEESSKLVADNRTGSEQKTIAAASVVGSIEPSNTSEASRERPRDGAACDDAPNAIASAGVQLPRQDTKSGDEEVASPSLLLEHSEENFTPKRRMRKEKSSKDMFDAISGIVQGDDEDGDDKGQLLAHLAAALSTSEPTPGSEYAAYVVGEEDPDEELNNASLLVRKVSAAALIESMESLSKYNVEAGVSSDEESNVDVQ